MFVGIVTIFSLTILAQSPTLQNVNSDKVVIQNYLTALSLPTNEGPKFFSQLPNDDKASLMRFHLAFQFLKRPWLNQSQIDFIFEVMSTISAESYDQSNPQAVALSRQNGQSLMQKSQVLFQKQEAVDIFANVSGNATDKIVLELFKNTTLSPRKEGRRQTFKRLSPIEMSLSMKIHLLRHMARPEMTVKQRRFLLEVVSFASPEVYALRKGTPERVNAEVAARLLSSKTPSFFKQNDAVEIFLSLGGVNEDITTSVAIKERKVNSLIFINANYFSSNLSNILFRKLEKSAITHQNLPGCGCNAEADLCDWVTSNTVCKRTVNCEPTQYVGCGYLWIYPCDGLCKNKQAGEETGN